jgi:heme/copper-type cytochrome/quinol oxidase subunit 2
LPLFAGDDNECLWRDRADLASISWERKKPLMGKLLVAIAVGIVFVVLCLGLYTLWRGGDTARSWSNKLMRIRVLAQFIAIIIIMAVLYFSQR